MAVAATEALLGEKPGSINEEVIDAVGELTNMIAGSAKSQLEQFEMSLSLPTVITGRNHTIAFGSGVKPIYIGFGCEWGPLSIEVGLAEQETVAAT